MELELIWTELQSFTLCHFKEFSHGEVWSLCNQLLVQCSIDVSQSVETYYGHIEELS